MYSDENQHPELGACNACGALIAADGRFCNHCGAKQIPEFTGATENKWPLFKQAALFYSIDIVVCCLASFVHYFKTLTWLLIFDLVMAISAVAFFCINLGENKLLLSWKIFSFKKLLGYCIIAVVASCLVHYTVGWLNIVIYNKDEHYFQLLKGHFWGVVFAIFFTAVSPALFEELGYRGYLLSAALKVADKEQAVYIVSFLFAIIHMSFISLFWLIPFALFLGFLRVKENTIWYGIFFHFSFNLTACLFDLL